MKNNLALGSNLLILLKYFKKNIDVITNTTIYNNVIASYKNTELLATFNPHIPTHILYNNTYIYPCIYYLVQIHQFDY